MLIATLIYLLISPLLYLPMCFASFTFYRYLTLPHTLTTDFTIKLFYCLLLSTVFAIQPFIHCLAPFTPSWSCLLAMSNYTSPCHTITLPFVLLALSSASSFLLSITCPHLILASSCLALPCYTLSLHFPAIPHFQ